MMGHCSSCGCLYEDVRSYLCHRTHDRTHTIRAQGCVKEQASFAAYSHHESSTPRNTEQAAWQIISWSTYREILQNYINEKQAGFFPPCALLKTKTLSADCDLYICVMSTNHSPYTNHFKIQYFNCFGELCNLTFLQIIAVLANLYSQFHIFIQLFLVTRRIPLHC